MVEPERVETDGGMHSILSVHVIRNRLRGEGGKRGGVKLEGEARVLSGAGRCTPDPLASRNNQVHRSMKRGSSLSTRALPPRVELQLGSSLARSGFLWPYGSVLCHTSHDRHVLVSASRCAVVCSMQSSASVTYSGVLMNGIDDD